MQILRLLILIIPLLACKDLSEMSPVISQQEEPKTFLALGDSYTIGESVEEQYRWPNILRDSLVEMGLSMVAPKIIAKTGWRTDQLTAAINNEELSSDYSLVSLLIGVNNQYQRRTPESYAPEFRSLLEVAISKASNDKSRVIVLSIPDYGYTPFGASNQEKISKELDEYNRINREITATYGVAYYDITPISREALDNPELVASDNLHPSGLQYARWVSEILKDKQLLERLR